MGIFRDRNDRLNYLQMSLQFFIWCFVVTNYVIFTLFWRQRRVLATFRTITLTMQWLKKQLHNLRVLNSYATVNLTIFTHPDPPTPIPPPRSPHPDPSTPIPPPRSLHPDPSTPIPPPRSPHPDPSTPIPPPRSLHPDPSYRIIMLWIIPPSLK